MGRKAKILTLLAQSLRCHRLSKQASLLLTLRLGVMKFYLQQEGEPLLNPLEASEIKLSAHKYRLIAQSSLKAGQGVDIRIRYHHPTHPKIYDYCQKVNDDGNIVIMPPTQLHPGRWEIHCCSDIIEEIIGEYWEKSFYFQVEAHTSMSCPLDRGNKYLQELEAVIRREVEPLLKKSSQGEPLPDLAKLQHQKPVLQRNDPEEVDLIPDPIIKLILDRSEIVRQSEDPLKITGRIEIENAIPNLVDCLQYELRHPLTEELIYCQKQPLLSQSSLFVFEHTLEIPQEGKISDLILMAQVMSATGESLASQSLTVITEMQEIPEQIEECLQYTLELSDLETKISYTFDIALEKPPKSVSLMVNLPEPQKHLKPLRPSYKSSHSTLPPRLSSNPEKKNHSALQLPILP